MEAEICFHGKFKDEESLWDLIFCTSSDTVKFSVKALEIYAELSACLIIQNREIEIVFYFKFKLHT